MFFNLSLNKSYIETVKIYLRIVKDGTSQPHYLLQVRMNEHYKLSSLSFDY